MTSSTSNSDHAELLRYKRFIKWMLYSSIALGGLILLLLIIIDPLDNISFSPGFKRAPIAFNQRFSYPAVARKPYFDSVVIGTSATRQLEPEVLNKHFNAHFANLSMNAATPYEQAAMTKLFFKHHPKAKLLIFGIDARPDVWCSQHTSAKYTFRQFPDWMYDENAWNDLMYLFNGLNIEIAFKQAAYLMGRKLPTYDTNGFADLMRGKTYSLERAREHIYRQAEPKPKSPTLAQPALTAEQQQELVFATIEHMKNLLDSVPEDTVKIIFFIPQHWFTQPVTNSVEDITLQKCKTDIHHIASSYKNTYLFDYLKQSAFTTTDTHYLDGIHLTKDAGDAFIGLLSVDVASKHIHLNAERNSLER